MKLLTNREYLALQQDITDAMRQAKDERIKRLAAEAKVLAIQGYATLLAECYDNEIAGIHNRYYREGNKMIADLAWQLWGYELRYGKQG